MIKNFAHKGLEVFFFTGSTKGIQAKHSRRLSMILDLLNNAGVAADMALRLSRAFNTTPELWLDLQRSVDLWEANQNKGSWFNVQPLNMQTA